MLKRSRWLMLPLALLAACTQGGAVPPTSGPVPPNSVTGTALDTQGRPIAGAKVWIDPAVTTGLAEATTDSSGRYLVTDLPSVPYYAKAWTEVEYEGTRFCLRLGMPNPSDYDSFTPDVGVVRDFQWQLSGANEDPNSYGGYFGSEVQLFLEGDMRGGEVELTFTPTGPLIDGSTGQTLVRTLDVTEEVMVYDIPIGTYAVTSVLLENGTRTPLKTGLESSWEGYEGQTDVAALAFKPNDSNGCAGSDGTQRAYLYLHSPYSY